MAGNINKSYQWAINTCNAPNVGYSQGYRNQVTVGGITYYDCSSFIWFALKAGGFDVVGAYNGQTWPFVTTTMGPVLLKLGFQVVDRSGLLLPGDIGVNVEHTEMYYTGGQGTGICMGAHTARATLANQVSIGSSGGDPTAESLGTRWDTIYRYGDGAEGGYGCSIYVVAAIAGNFMQESNINPGIWESLVVGSWTGLNHGYGLGQWTNTGGDTHGRLYQLHDYLEKNGYSDDSGEGQMNFLIEENTWYSQQEASAFSSLQDFLTSTSTDLTLLTHAWNIGWEGIHDASWDLRVRNAERCLEFIQAHANDTSINQWITGNRYLSDSEMLNNAVMLYRFLSSGGGGGGTQGKKHTMPLWMYCRYTY